MCENCKERAENPARYKLKMEWIGHGQAEEFHQKHGNGYMKEHHKSARIRLEQLLRA